MATKHQKIDIELPLDLSAADRRKIGEDIIELIFDRTNQGIDKDGKPFKKYSASYVKSLDFKIAGKSKSKIDLQLSGDMLAAMKVLDATKDGKVTIGFEKGSEENAKADGNIRGTYGQSRASASKARDFLGISKQDLNKILAFYTDEEIGGGDDGEEV